MGKGMKPTYGSLFSGVGGFDMGFDQAGFDCQWQVEWDPQCQQTLNYHWPDVPKYGNVQHVKGNEITPVDVIIYGSPCQDLSAAGKRAGIGGEKSSMFFESVRIFEEMRNATGGTFPRIVVWENVAGALTSNKGADFHAVLRTLDDAGAVSQWWSVLDAQFFGVPQRRRRVFLVSVFDTGIAESIGDGQILAVGESVRGNTPKSRQKEQELALIPEEGSGEDSGTPQAIIFSHTQGLDAQPSRVASPTLRSNGSGMAIAYNFDEYNFTGGDEVHHSLRAGTKQSTGVVTETIVRRLSPIECERLMGWPDNHTLYRADGKKNPETVRFKMCGNGVATPVARWVGEQIRPLLA
jgi:DNA (cytosine-5)-methyltransferase 1